MAYESILCFAMSCVFWDSILKLLVYENCFSVSRVMAKNKDNRKERDIYYYMKKIERDYLHAFLCILKRMKKMNDFENS